MQGLFITSNNTDVGKTFISCLIIKALNDKFIVEVRKPIETNCSEIAGKLLPNDAKLLQSALKVKQDIDIICPYKFKNFASGEVASLGKNITLENIVDKCQSDNFMIIEGAGGFYSPLIKDKLNSDLAIALKLAVVIVIEDKIGAISEALLTIEAVKNCGLNIFAVVLNQKIINDLDNLKYLQKYSDENIINFNPNNFRAFNCSILSQV